MGTQVYLIRHGETLWNTERRLQGQLDSPLTADGLQQASLLAAKLSAVRFDAFYSSDLGRARHTAEIIASRSAQNDITFDERIRERHFGSFQGLTWEEIKEKFPEEAAKEMSGNPMNVVPGGESKQVLLSRTVSFFDEIALRHVDQKILVISHEGVLNVWTRHVLHIPLNTPRRFHLHHTAINIFEFYMKCWNLRQLGKT
jgi:2,3-bisphosphoglycerate-dependent phosphoglycerate mutase